MAVLAELRSYTEADDRRSSGRRTLRLELATSVNASGSHVLVHNISERGLLLESATALEPGDVLVVDLLEAGATPAEVVWVRDGFAGCEFPNPISKAAISAGLLKSAPADLPYTIPFTQPKAIPEPPYHPTLEVEDGPWMRAMMFVCLVLAAVAAMLFIAALLTAPFAVS